LKIVLDWHQKHLPQVKSHRNVDENLSSFGNLVSRFLHTLEDDFQVACLHKEIFLAFAASLGVYEYSYSLKHHVLFSGASAKGKSFILSLLHRFLIPGSVQSVSYETALANSTETNMNATILTYDEVSADLFKPGVGDPELKERLTTGKTNSRVFTTQDGRRKTLRVESKQQILMIGNTNESFDKLVDAIHTRFHCREIEPIPVPAGRELINLLASQPDLAAQEAFISELHAVQAQLALIYTKIYTGLLPPVDMTEAYNALARVQTYVKGFGLDVSPRDMIRLILLAKSLAIWSAVDQAYFSHQPTSIISPIRCTRKMALFCLTEPSIYSPKLKRIIQGLKYTPNADVTFDYCAIACKKPDPLLLELCSHTIDSNGRVSPVVGQHPLRILRLFVEQEPLDILKRAIQHVIPVGKVVVGWGEEPHKWLVLN